MNPVALVTILYLVIVLLVGYCASRKKVSGSIREFLIAEGQLRWLLLLPLLMSELVTANTTVALAEYGIYDRYQSVNVLYWFVNRISPAGFCLRQILQVTKEGDNG